MRYTNLSPEDEHIVLTFLEAFSKDAYLWMQDYFERLEEIERSFGIKYDPNQPRVPAGNSNGGQWTDSGSGSNSGRNASRTKIPLPVRKPARNNFSKEVIDRARRINQNAPPGLPPEYLEIHPNHNLPIWYVGGVATSTVSPLDFIGLPARNLAKAGIAGAAKVAKLLRARAIGAYSKYESNKKIRRAVDAVEEFLGGRPDPKSIRINKKGDIIIMRGNKKFRMDVKNPGTKMGPDGKVIADEPHFHLQELRNGKWRDAGKGHRHYFEKGN